MNMGWNDYLDWDLPDLTYQGDASAWSPSEGAVGDRAPSFADAESPIADAADDLSDVKYRRLANSELCGLRPRYSTGTQDLSSITLAVITRPRLSSSKFTSYESTSLDNESQPADQTYGSQLWLPKINHPPTSSIDGALPRIPSDGAASSHAKELRDLSSFSSEDENGRRATIDANKKRKIAHSVIEKKYRSRIKNGMTELRLCVPSTITGPASLDSQRPGGQPAAEGVTPTHSSGKLTTLCDAVQYVKSLELQNEVLHGKLDVMQRRNKALQRIALSKVNTNKPATTMAV